MGKMTFRSLSILSLEISRSNLTVLKLFPSKSLIYIKYRALKFFSVQAFWFLIDKRACSVLMAKNMKVWAYTSEEIYN